MTLTIRKAVPGDGALIARFVRELAIYEKLEHEMEADAASFEAALFSDRPHVFCDIAEWQGEAAGFALWFYNYSTFLGRHGIYLEDLYVSPSMRGHGIGKGLLVHLARRCVEEGLGRLDWQVLDWNAPSIDFYESQGAKVLREWLPCRVTGAALAELAEGRA
ncbi:Acetyltransferase (GNAT) family protein [Hartmannibacter diazotrophicus]|uniref:Acetyltransferase (GNAT) family protein n=1 Tax=Hartmannibacter diazotrophicus TaxID=1482074 RepID=A0A2C9D8B3_9HYPH|nr:GNAT family N-acetyltransferase [Hartmannibacter diazotrophicus]SON56419.1 Acetyltransferase (GNAT) family protein [Hartmannibacter diazotrophicus]